MMNYQEQLGVELMRKLAPIAADYHVNFEPEYSNHWIDIMNDDFDLAYEEIYGYLPHGC